LIVANGGSATAGAKIPLGTTYDYKLAEYLKETNVSNANIKVTNRGHGAKTSFHSAQLGWPWFFIPGTDVLIWEFAINDFELGRKDEVEERNQLIFWLEQVSKMDPPPLVIMAYIWKSPFKANRNSVDNPIFAHHKMVATEYDFVVGHVNLASYLQELDFGFYNFIRHFLADWLHPSQLGHAVLAFLIIDLITDEDRLPPVYAGETFSKRTKTPAQWTCGNETDDKRLIQSLVQGSSLVPHSPIASFTRDLPQNEGVVYPGMLVHKKEDLSNAVLEGKAAENRIDRQYTFKVPCCKRNETIAFTVPSETNLTNMRAVQLAFSRQGAPKRDVQVYLDSKLVPGHSFSTARWPCNWAYTGMYDVRWYAFDHEYRHKVSEMQICGDDDCCDTAEESMTCTGLLSFAVIY
jgi:hypothetical protein